MARLLARLGAGAHRHRLLVVLLWLSLLAGAGVGAATLAGETSDSFAIPGQESTTALERIDEEFGSTSSGATAKVVFRAPSGQTLSEPANAAALTQVVADLAQLPGALGASNPLDPAAPTVSADLSTGYSTVAYESVQGEVTEEQRDALREAVDDARASGLTVEATGTALLEPPHTGGPAEALGVVIALLVLALTYGSLVAAGMNLLTAVVGVGVGAAGIVIATGFLELQSTTPVLALMLGLAVGIDYALFIVSRFRHELRHTADVGAAVRIAVGTAGSAVLTAGLTVVIALVGLSVVGIPFLTQMGLAAAATVVVAVLVAVTLVPAVLGFVGWRALPRNARTPLGPEVGEEAEHPHTASVYGRWVDAVTRRRVLTVLLSVLALAAVAVPAASMQTTLVQTPAEGTSEARAEQLLADAFGGGVNGPLVVLVEGERAVEQATALLQDVASLDHVAAALPPQPNADGSAALLTVIPDSGPTTQATEDLVADVRALVAGTDGLDASVTGATAVSVDVAQSLDEALPVYLALVVGLALVLLVLVFRSVLVPLVGVLGFLLSVGAALGATTAVFQWGWLAGAINLDSTGPLLSLTPILVIGILFGLAMDYQIFLVSRMHEAQAHGAEPLTAIRTGFRHAAPVVVAAAAIMFFVFAGFVPSGDAAIKSIAFALAVGILFDALVVRMVLVPAALALFGSAAWWFPGWLGWLPELDVEGAALVDAEPALTEQEPAAAGSR